MINESKKLHYVYQIKNEINGKIYIGKHSTNNFDDNYMGSGTRITRAIKKYGIENFTKRIIDVCLTEEQAFELESFIVDKEFIERSDTYNILIGGAGGIVWSSKARKNLKEVNKDRVYLNDGWIVGRCKKKNKNYFGSVRINNGTKEKSIKRDVLNNYLDSGWKLGRLPFSDEYKINMSKTISNRKRMTKGDKEISIKVDEVDKYLNDGWKLGRRRKI